MYLSRIFNDCNNRNACCIYLYLLMRSSIAVKNGTEPIALNALSSRLQGRKRFFSAAGVFLPVTFVASTSPRLTFPIVGHPVNEEERRALNAYRFPYTTHVTSFPPIYVLFHAHNGQSAISILPAPDFSRSWFPGLIRVNEQKCRFRKWRKHFGLCVWPLTHANFYLSLNDHFV